MIDDNFLEGFIKRDIKRSLSVRNLTEEEWRSFWGHLQSSAPSVFWSRKQITEDKSINSAFNFPFKKIPLALRDATDREKAVFKFRLEKGL